MPPEYSKYFGMVEDFAHAMATDTLKAEIPMPGPFTKEGVEIILGYLKMQSSETRVGNNCKIDFTRVTWLFREMLS